MDPLQIALARLAELRAQRTSLIEARGALIDKAAAEKRGFTADEQSAYDTAGPQIDAVDAQIPVLEARVTQLQEKAQRDAAAAKDRVARGDVGPDAGGTRVTDPEVYARGNRQTSYFRDLAKAQLFGDRDALDRLVRNSQAVTEQRALGNTGAVGGSGGEFAPPAWVINEWINVIRAGRVTANLFRHEDVPPGVSSINYPKLLTGTTTAIQTTQNTALSQTDLTTGSVQTGFATIGGKQVVSQQLLDQSALNFDDLIMADLASDYGLRVGTQVYTGTGTGSGTGAVVNGLGAATIGTTQTWTQATPTPAGFYGQAGQLLSNFLTARLLPPTCWVMHPRRWYWLASSTDTNGRPLVVPTGAAYNPMAVQPEPSAAAPMGLVGYFHGLPVYIDPLVPIASNQDKVYLLKTDDLVLFESQPIPEVFRETYADSVGVLYRMYGYVGTVLNRHTESIGVITGTGLTTPTFNS